MSPFEIVAGTVVVLAAAVVLRRRKKRRLRALMEPVARARGGTLRSPVGGMPSIRFEHRDTEAALAYRRRGSPSSEHSGRHFRLRLRPSPSPDVQLHIRHRPTRRVLRDLERVPISGRTFGERYRVDCDDRGFAIETLSSELRERFADFAHGIDVRIEEGELTAEWSATTLPRDAAELERTLAAA
ncbi:MAG: hypothetical protein ACODAE_06490, partial [Gemmatimonadota bacterium]